MSLRIYNSQWGVRVEKNSGCARCLTSAGSFHFAPGQRTVASNSAGAERELSVKLTMIGQIKEEPSRRVWLYGFFLREGGRDIRRVSFYFLPSLCSIYYTKKKLWFFFLFSFFSISLCVNRNYSRQEDREETIQYLPISFLFFPSLPAESHSSHAGTSHFTASLHENVS